MKSIVLKTDFVQEVCKVLSEGREVRIRAQTQPDGAVDIEVIVVARPSGSPPIYSLTTITALNVIQAGPDSCFTEAVKTSNFDVSRHV